MLRCLMILMALIWTTNAVARDIGGTFPSIDGGTLQLEDWRGGPVLVINTASHCGFTDQYADMQALYDTYRDQGLVVLAVPSDDFNQELDSAAEVKHFCEINYGLDFPMTDIERVKGGQAHAFYQAVRAKTGFEPNWNFNKVLLGPDGTVEATWRSVTRPTSKAVTDKIEALLD